MHLYLKYNFDLCHAESFIMQHLELNPSLINYFYDLFYDDNDSM